MTTEQRERIEAVVKPGVAVYNVPSAKALEDLVEIAGGTIAPATNGLYNDCVKGYGFDNAGFGYDPDDNIWRQSPRRWFAEEGWIMVNYTDLPMETQDPLIIGMQAAAKAQGINLEWLDIDTQFTYGAWDKKFVCKIGLNGEPGIYDIAECHLVDGATLISMLNHPDQIHPISKYSAALKQTAKIFMDAGSLSVEMYGKDAHIKCVDGSGFAVPSKMFDGIQPGQCVALADIVGGE